MAGLAESDMYDWRVKALNNWIDTNKNSDGTLSMDRLAKAGHLDQYHYLGLQANEEVIKILGLKPGMSLLDVGCGIGGPARYIAWKSGCQVTGVDIQPNLVDAGNKISAMVGLGNLVTLFPGEVTDSCVFPDESFDAFVSLLVILHIPYREKLFASLFALLKSGGGFVIEDMIALDTFDTEQDRIAKEVVGAPSLPRLEEYRLELEKRGFIDIEFETLTPLWIDWCVNRSDQYEASRDEQIRMHGLKVFQQRSSFYADVKNLFLSGKLGGFRITGRKPSYIEKALWTHRQAKPDAQPPTSSERIIE